MARRTNIDDADDHDKLRKQAREVLERALKGETVDPQLAQLAIQTLHVPVISR